MHLNFQVKRLIHCSDIPSARSFQVSGFTRTYLTDYVTAVVWENFTVKYFHIKIVHVKVFLCSRAADENFNNKLILRSTS